MHFRTPGYPRPPLVWAVKSARLAVVLGKLKNKQARLQKLDEADGGSRWGAAVKEKVIFAGSTVGGGLRGGCFPHSSHAAPHQHQHQH